MLSPAKQVPTGPPERAFLHLDGYMWKDTCLFISCFVQPPHHDVHVRRGGEEKHRHVCLWGNLGPSTSQNSGDRSLLSLGGKLWSLGRMVGVVNEPLVVSPSSLAAFRTCVCVPLESSVRTRDVSTESHFSWIRNPFTFVHIVPLRWCLLKKKKVLYI
jgi:hypothetical protein